MSNHFNLITVTAQQSVGLRNELYEFREQH